MAKRSRSEDEDDDLQYADHDYEVPQQKGLKKLWNRVKWTRDEIPGYQYVSPEGNCVEHVQTPAFMQPPFIDEDPDKEKKIKELELLLMSAENEVRRKRVSSQPGSFSSWSGSFLMDDSMSNTLNSLEEHTSEFYSMDENQTLSAQQNSPTKFLAVEANAVLSSLQTIPEFAETLELIESSQPLAFLEEDIREVLKEETGTDIFLKEEDEPAYKSCKQEHTASVKKVRKSLVLDNWEKEEPGTQLLTEDISDMQSENIFTTSLLMIPLLEIHDNRCNLTPEKQDIINSTNKTYTLNKKKPNPNTSKVVTLEKNLQSNCEWETVVYGKTEDQLIMTEQARRYLSTYTATSSTSRALIL
ncbi:hypothetical protein GH733_007889 [Mirounga leonina]|nr:hypothetical protein GH733_007889 [Mirounga leonina]